MDFKNFLCVYLCLRSTQPSLNNSIFQQEQKYHENEIWILLLFVFVVHCLSLPPKLVGGYMHYVASSAVPGLQTPYIFKASGFWPIEEQSLILKLSLFEKYGTNVNFQISFPPTFKFWLNIFVMKISLEVTKYHWFYPFLKVASFLQNLIFKIQILVEKKNWKSVSALE